MICSDSAAYIPKKIISLLLSFDFVSDLENRVSQSFPFFFWLGFTNNIATICCTGPLSRSLLVLGYADRSLGAVRKIIDVDSSEDGGLVCDGLHVCMVAVKLADEPKRFERLEPKHKINSLSFAKYVTQLRESRKVAILAKDKYDRFGMLVPFEQTAKKDGGSKFGANDFAARIYIGEIQEVIHFLAASSGGNTTSTSNTESDIWRPTTPPIPSDGGWKPTTPPMPSGGNPWESNDDDGPTFQPEEDNHDDGPTFRPDNDDDNGNEDGWKPSTPQVPQTTGGGSSMPWETTEDGNGDSSSSAMPWEDSTSKNSKTDVDNNTSLMPWGTSGDDNNEGGTSSSMPWDTGGKDETESANLPWTNDTNGNDVFSTKKRSFEEFRRAGEHNCRRG